MLFPSQFITKRKRLSIRRLPKVGSEVRFTNERYATSRREQIAGIGCVEEIDEVGCYTVVFQRGPYWRRVYLMAEDLEVIP